MTGVEMGSEESSALATEQLQSGFMLLHGNRLEGLSELLVAWLARHPLEPLESELILVQSNGIAEWLKQRLAAPVADGGLGIAASTELVLPASLLWRLYRASSDDIPEQSPFERETLVWRLYRLLGQLDLSRPEYEPLHGYLAADRQQGGGADPNPVLPARRRHQLAGQIANLFDQYQVYRADWLTNWQRNPERERLLSEGIGDRQLWQPMLWRALRNDMEQRGEVAISRADIHRTFINWITNPDLIARPAAIPRRVVIFGISSLPRQTIEALAAIARFSQVMLFVHNPSRYYWGDLIEGRDLFRKHYSRQQRRQPVADENSLHLSGHPLLAAWGRQGRDYIHMLDEFDEQQSYSGHFSAIAKEIDLFETASDATLLGQLQNDILQLSTLEERRESGVQIDPAEDVSLTFTIAHSRQREVEILHDQILACFASDDQLEPRDLLVMVPEIDHYAPHIEAVFGRFSPAERRHVPYHIADRGERNRSQLLITLERLLGLPRSRMTANDLFDLLELPALRERFGIGDGDLPTIQRWVRDAGIRWGLDGEQRRRIVPAASPVEINTVRFGLKRMLLGYAVGRGHSWSGIEPYDEVGGIEARLVGQLAQLIDELERTLHQLDRHHSADEWCDLLGELLDRYLLPTNDEERSLLERIAVAIEQWHEQCRIAGSLETQLPVDVVREALLTTVERPRLSQRFLAGSVNFATLMPMRAVPFRMIWLLGMEDGSFPRQSPPSDFDLMRNDYRPGDRSRREDDRYLFLEAILSARERLTISWLGRTQRDNSPRPPSVVVGQLRDHISAGWRLCDRADPQQSVADALTLCHPLQPFSRDYFTTGRDRRLFTYADEWRSAHDQPEAHDSKQLLSAGMSTGVVTLKQLSRLLVTPLELFYRERLGVIFDREVAPTQDDESFSPNALEEWLLDEQIIRQVVEAFVGQPIGETIDSSVLIERGIDRVAGAGALPFPPFRELSADELRERLHWSIDRYRIELEQARERIDSEWVEWHGTHHQLADRLSGLLIDKSGRRRMVVIHPSTLWKDKSYNWHKLLPWWPVHLAAQLGGETTTLIIGRGAAVTLSPPDKGQAGELLQRLLDWYSAAIARPLPLACRSGFTWLTAKEGQREEKARLCYEGGEWRNRPERDSHSGYLRLWPTWDELLAANKGGSDSFGALSEQLYRPLVELVKNVEHEVGSG